MKAILTSAILTLALPASANERYHINLPGQLILAQAPTTAQPGIASDAGVVPVPAGTSDSGPALSPAPAEIGASAAAAAAESTAQPAAEATGELLKSVGKVMNDWQNVGWLGGCIALINLVILLLRFGPVDEWFTVNKKKWLKPYIAIGLGAIGGGLTAYSAGAGIMNGVVSGLMAGLGSVGLYEAIDKRKASSRER